MNRRATSAVPPTARPDPGEVVLDEALAEVGQVDRGHGRREPERPEPGPAIHRYPVLRRPAAMPFIVTSSARSRRLVGLAAARPPQQLDLHQVDRIDVRVADVDRAAEHRVVADQLAVAGHGEHRGDGARSRARSSSPSGWRSGGTSSRS